LTELNVAHHWWPPLHCHCSLVWLFEYSDRHAPPRDAASSFTACTGKRNRSSAHFLHQWPWRMACATARQR
jgi:hypothetical protein